MKKGFSFLELMVVLTISSIIFAIAMPSYVKYTEKSKGMNAEANLIIIYNMEKRYKRDYNVYYECATAGCNPLLYNCPVTPCASTLINNNLGTFIRDPYFTYKIDIMAPNDYIVIATRANSGPCANKIMSITGLDKTIVKDAASGGCDIW